MDRFPALRLILRYGRFGAIVLALLLALGVAGALWASVGWPALGIALVIGAIGYLFIKSYVEIVYIVIEMVH